jgi:MFS family permease
MSTLPGGVWRHPHFVRLWAGQAASMVGSMVGGFAFNLAAILVLHAGPPQIALLSACSLFPGAVAGPLIGVLADRVRHRPLLIATDLCRAAAYGSIPLAAFSGHLTMLQLYLVAAAASVLTMTFDVSFRAYVPVVLGGRGLVEANGVLQGTAAVSEAGGWGASGLLVQAVSAPVTVAIDALSFLVSALSLATLRSAPDGGAEREAIERPSLGALTDGLREVARDPLLRPLTLSACAAEITSQPVGVVIMLFCLHDLHLTPALMGPIFGVGGISAFAGSVVCERIIRQIGLGHTLIGSIFLRHAGLLAMVVAGGPLPLILVLCVAAQLTDAGWSIHDIAVTTLLQETAPPHLAGRVFATYETARSASMLAGLGLGALLGAVLPLRAVLALAFLAGLLVPLVLILSPVRSLRRPVEAAA